MNSQEKLAFLFKRDLNNFISCVPIVGSGLNLQAARIENKQEDNWSGLLQQIAIEMDRKIEWLETLPHSNLSRWESMLRFWATKNGIEPYQAELQLQKFTCNYLRQREEKSSNWKLYREFASARFKDIISLNFDRRLALSWNKLKFITAPSKCPEGSHGETLYRHDLLSHKTEGQTRIWYPHGDTKKYSTLKLGNRRYGFYVVTFEESMHHFGDKWRFKRNAFQVDIEQPEYSQIPKWTDVFQSRNVAFIGCGLSLDEWPLWWMIRKRSLANISSGRANKAHTYYITAEMDGQNGFLQKILKQYNIEVINFASFSEMWECIRETLRI